MHEKIYINIYEKEERSNGEYRLSLISTIRFLKRL